MIVSRVSGLEANIVDWYGRLLELGSIRYTCRGINNNIYTITIALLCLHFTRNTAFITGENNAKKIIFVVHESISKNSSEWLVCCDDGLLLWKFNISARFIFPNLHKYTIYYLKHQKVFLPWILRSLLLKQWDVLGYKRKRHKSHP